MSLQFGNDPCRPAPFGKGGRWMMSAAVGKKAFLFEPWNLKTGTVEVLLSKYVHDQDRTCYSLVNNQYQQPLIMFISVN